MYFSTVQYSYELGGLYSGERMIFMSTNEHVQKKAQGVLAYIERIGNKVPDITILFIGAFIITCVISAVLSNFSFDYINPATGKPIQVVNMLSTQSLITLSTKMVSNYASFPPLGMVIVATLGIGIAEGSGYIAIGLRKLLAVTPKSMITPMIIVVGMLSHLGPDCGYVIIIPIAAHMFYASGKHPLAGIAASFAGIAGAFAANYTPSAIDPVIQGFTQAAAQIIDDQYLVNILCNYFYMFIATFAVIPICWYITERIVDPWLWKMYPLTAEADLSHVPVAITTRENRAFTIASIVFVFVCIALVWCLTSDTSGWRAPDGSLASFKAPIMQSIVSLIFLLAGVVGVIYGYASGNFKTLRDMTYSMETITHTLVPLIVFYFFAAQFLYAFNASQMGALIAVSGAEFLRNLALPPQLTIFGIIVFVGILNLVITSASAKWAVLAPIFVPMLMGVNISPELTQQAFRISDSAVNIVTPMFAFYPLIISYCQKYVKEAGIGTLSSMMVPYTMGLLVGLTIVLYVMWFFDIPLGIQATYTYPR